MIGKILQQRACKVGDEKGAFVFNSFSRAKVFVPHEQFQQSSCHFEFAYFRSDMLVVDLGAIGAQVENLKMPNNLREN